MADYFSVQTDFETIWPRIAAELDKRARFAVALALTRTIQAVQARLVEELRKQFESPTPFTLKALAITPAIKTRLQATVYVRDRQATYLAPEFEGGARNQKTYEQIFGRTLTAVAGEISLPGAGITLNQYGNITLGQIKKIAAEIGSGKSKTLFVGAPHGAPEGIYRRDGRHLHPLLIFQPTAHYRVRIHMQDVAREATRSNFAAELTQAWASYA